MVIALSLAKPKFCLMERSVSRAPSLQRVSRQRKISSMAFLASPLDDYRLGAEYDQKGVPRAPVERTLFD